MSKPSSTSLTFVKAMSASILQNFPFDLTGGMLHGKCSRGMLTPLERMRYVKSLGLACFGSSSRIQGSPFIEFLVSLSNKISRTSPVSAGERSFNEDNNKDNIIYNLAGYQCKGWCPCILSKTASVVLCVLSNLSLSVKRFWEACLGACDLGRSLLNAGLDKNTKYIIHNEQKDRYKRDIS